MPDSIPLHPLLPHSAAIAPADLTLAAGFAWQADGSLRLHYRMRGKLDALRIPPPSTPQQTDGLWQHTCCEAFITEGDGSAYREFNLAPSGCWAAYRFTTYRQRDEGWQPSETPLITCQHHAGSLLLVADIPAALLPPGARRLGLTAVVETVTGERSYWALHHAGQQPDFHLSDSFTLPLNRP